MKIPFCVICAHLILIGTTLFFHSAPQKIVKRSPIAVKTYLTPTPQTTKVIPLTPTVNQASLPTQPTNPQVTTPPKTSPKNVPIAIKPTKTPSTTKTESNTKAQDKPKASHAQLITLMQKSLQTLDGSNAKAETTHILGALASEALHFENRYEEELISFLESCLSFPEKGEQNEKVKLKLTLKRDGSVQKVEILQAHSEKNRCYCESTLSSLSFPPFGTYFKGKNQKIFTLTLITEHRSH